MEKMKLQVSGSQIQVVQRPAAITAGTVGLEVEFTFDSHWDNLGKTVIFRAGDKVITAALEQDTHIVPWEVLEKPEVWLVVGVYGANTEGTVVIPTLWTKVAAVYTGVEPEGDPALEPANPIWQQTLARVATMEPLVQEHINSTDNPHGITCDQIGAVTQKEFRDVVSNLDGSSDPEGLIPHLLNRDNPHGVTAAQVGAAPAGYGYGELIYIGAQAGVSLAEKLDAETESWADRDNKQCMLYEADFYGQGIIATISKYNNDQIIVNGATYDGYQVVRRKIGGVWQSWEWVNPPFSVRDKEYRTTERFGGKPVYAKWVDFGVLPATGYTEKLIVYNIDKIVRLDGCVYYSKDSNHNWKFPITTFKQFSEVALYGNSNLRFTVSADVSMYSAYAAIYYTKL